MTTAQPPIGLIICAMLFILLFVGSIIRWDLKRWKAFGSGFNLHDRVVYWRLDPGQWKTGKHCPGSVVGIGNNHHNACDPLYAVRFDDTKAIEYFPSWKLEREVSAP